MAGEARAIPIIATLAIHGLFAAGLHAAEGLVKTMRPPSPLEVTFEVKPPPPPPPPPPPIVEPPPPEEKPKVAEKKPPKKVATVKEPPREPPPEVPPPAPGPPDDDAPAAQRVYVMPGGGMVVNPGSATGTATGRPGGTGKGTGGGGPPGSTGSGKAVPLASVSRMPEALGDYDLSKDYPAEAKRNGIQGEVAVRLLVGADGRVTETKLARGLSGGLNEKAIELGRRIRFKPALDDSGAPVATWITWTFNFRLPR